MGSTTTKRCTRCGRALPESEARAGYTECEHCDGVKAKTAAKCICGPDPSGEAPEERSDCPVHGADAAADHARESLSDTLSQVRRNLEHCEFLLSHATNPLQPMEARDEYMAEIKSLLPAMLREIPESDPF